LSTYLQMPEDAGIEPAFITKDGVAVPNPKAGEPQPLCQIGVPMSIPVMADGEVIDSSQTFTILPADALKEGEWARIVPGTRTVEVNHDGLEGVLRNLCGFVDAKAAPKTTRKSQED